MEEKLKVLSKVSGPPFTLMKFLWDPPPPPLTYIIFLKTPPFPLDIVKYSFGTSQSIKCQANYRTARASKTIKNKEECVNEVEE